MKTKIFALIILAIIALTSVGYSYACLNGGIQVDCYPTCYPSYYCSVVFIKVRTYDNEIEKDVGKVYAQISCDGRTITVYINNSYPCYKAYINFTIKNKGCYPAHIDEVTVQDYNKTALEIQMINIIACTWISPSETISGLLTVHTLQPAQECHTYTFSVVIKFSCETERHPCTIGFWKNQFSSCSCKSGDPQVPAATLLTYLNQISSQSIIKFTGTQTQKFQQALNILSPPNNAIMKDKLKAQLLALWLNYEAGWTDGYKVSGMTAWQIIQGSENALKNGLTSQYEYWKNLCDQFNNLGG
jgi:hypothetical protein